MASDRAITAAPLRLGTRKSPMAMVQSRQVARLITERTGRAVELVGITTFGDVSRAQLAQIGGTGVFVSGLRACLLAGEVDFAVHSLKDLPTAPPEGIALAAVTAAGRPEGCAGRARRRQARRSSAAARIGTGSPRRAAQLLLLRPDLRPVPVRGNAGTRLSRVTSGEVDAVVLAYAGLARIGRLDAVTQVFEPDEMLPAAGQGALAVECSADRPDLAGLLACADDPASHAATTAERSVLAALASRLQRPGRRVCRRDERIAAAGGRRRSRRGDGAAGQRGAARRPRPTASAARWPPSCCARGAGRYMTVSDGHISSGDDDQ